MTQRKKNPLKSIYDTEGIEISESTVSNVTSEGVYFPGVRRLHIVLVVLSGMVLCIGSMSFMYNWALNLEKNEAPDKKENEKILPPPLESSMNHYLETLSESIRELTEELRQLRTEAMPSCQA